ncbi:hypothetical protein V6N11_016163 [Hibiscus sabdariffa]|uniref:Uncharacterized protein n=1 Tax=Hibiscus sabdariffa TaxID=183260 RepID=A0ABR2TUH3_9ROSI
MLPAQDFIVWILRSKTRTLARDAARVRRTNRICAASPVSPSYHWPPHFPKSQHNFLFNSFLALASFPDSTSSSPFNSILLRA